MALEIIQMTLPQSKYNIKCPYAMPNPSRVVVHNTASDASAKSEISYMQGNGYEVSYHYAVDDVRAVQGLPLNRNGWHAGDGQGAGNRQGIGVEICYSKSGGDRFIKAEKNGALLVAMILVEKGWGLDRVTKHQDYWQGTYYKYCPHRTLDLGWQRFLNMVQAEVNNLKGVAVAQPASNGLKYVDYRATIMAGGYSVDSKPWGEAGHENWGNTTNLMYKAFHFREEDASGAYANGDWLGWVDKRALGKERKDARYTATVIADWYSVDSLPWGEAGCKQLGTTANHVNTVVTVLMETLNGEYAYIRNAEKEIGWVDKRALVDGIVVKQEPAVVAPEPVVAQEPVVEKEKVVVESVLFLPNGEEWVIYPENGDYEIGEVISVEGKEGSWYKIVGDKGNGIIVVDFQKIGRKAIRFDESKGATITKKYA